MVNNVNKKIEINIDYYNIGSVVTMFILAMIAAIAMTITITITLILVTSFIILL